MKLRTDNSDKDNGLDKDFEIDERIKDFKNRRRRRKERKEKGFKIPAGLWISFFIIIAVIIAGVAAVKSGVFDDIGTNTEPTDIEALFSIDEEDEVGILYNDEYIETTGITENGEVYLPYEFVRTELNGDLYYNENDGNILYSTPTETVVFNEDSGDLKVKDGTAYISLTLISKYTDLDKTELFTDPYRVVIRNQWGEAKTATVKRKAWLRRGPSRQNTRMKELVKGESLRIVSVNEIYSYAETEDGLLGYVENKRLGEITDYEETPASNAESFEYSSIHYDEPIVLGWHQVFNDTANSYIDDYIGNSGDLNVIAPTWLTLTSTDGSFSNLCSSDYVTKAHNAGIKVWAVVDNFNSSDFAATDDSYTLLSNTAVRQKLASELVSSVTAVGADGLNVDFELLSTESGPHFAQFIRELSIECRKASIALSVDNYVPKAYSELYHREVQGKVADYVVIMGYDEYNTSSEEAGPVASSSFVDDGIAKTLEDVDKSKLINAIPLYTRIWTTKDGTLNSQAVGMSDASAFVANHSLEGSWDESSGYNYYYGEDGSGSHQVWLEDLDSIKAKLDIMKKYELAGVAFWRLGFDESGVWDAVNEWLK